MSHIAICLGPCDQYQVHGGGAVLVVLLKQNLDTDLTKPQPKFGSGHEQVGIVNRTSNVEM